MSSSFIIPNGVKVLKSPLIALAVLLTPLAVQAAEPKPYKIEWVYRVRYGYQAEFWSLFQKNQLPVLDREKALGYVTDYVVYRPGLHTSEDSRWDYRVEITYADQTSSSHGAEIEAQLFPDKALYAKEEQRRWELTLNHWDLPIHAIDPHVK